ncbi:YcjF family protein [Rhodobacteraceae bacterium N5(2021)]|uniref:YcjF family protein n=1 Tax=Gymnodinialimonas phycosphaerae TaxID=2841589 RepID=A0A975TRL4_9RHOB|nr:YcjF family protein [Gymnodinialimonas phycosphaerae]MBY4893262.1 YcjF family protein [Gymnodinialimonas phycosphaerae]
MTERKGPVLIELDEAPEAGPEAAAPVPDAGLVAPDGRAMQVVATLGAKRPSRLARFFWSAVLGLIGFAASLAAWNFVTGLLAANPILGWIAFGLIAAVLLALVLIALRELAAFSRLGRLDRVHRAAEAALAEGDLKGARAVVGQLSALYAGRAELRLGRDTLDRQREDLFDAASLFALAEAEVMASLDQAAAAEIEAAARQVATVTALVPLALADVAVALTANLRMIRRIAEVYGGRAGTLGSWRLTRAVMTHLVATGAVAIGDDLLGSALGGSVLSKLSRRFGEGVVNGALTARVGLAAMEVCRPLPFGKGRRPSVTGLIRRALTGIISKTEG